MPPLIEVCVEGFENAKIAIEAGADRLELNSRLDLDGLTPAYEDLVAVRQVTSIPMIAMLRPHANSFIYDRDTQLAMLRDLERLLASGVDGVAVGGLMTSGEIDLGLMKELRKHTADKVLVMHRAFDQLRDQAGGLEQLIDVGVDRVLTSGGAVTAEAGMEQLRSLIVQSRGRIEILPGAGIRPSNALAILQGTGCNQLHGTFKQ
ncbi:MAG: copper homeostasis protein CutC, partial [Pirellulaceae bacterium]|nr:copper homeostasis protein CutC [Pirellulaceae bacterium]